MIPAKILSDDRFKDITDDQWKVADMVIKHGINYLSPDIEDFTQIPQGTYTSWYYRNTYNYKELLQTLAKLKYGTHELEVLENVATRAKTSESRFSQLYMQSQGHLEPANKQDINVQINVISAIPNPDAPVNMEVQE